jgi:hypothetical protein
MNLKADWRVVFFAVGLCVATSLPALADDSAAAIAAGGLVPRRETRIVMAKEVLRISEKKVVVDYDFRNDTDEDVTTEVAFPIPPYTNEFADGPALEEQSFQSFKLWVNGKPVSYASEATATLDGKDVTAILKANHLDIPTFGHFVDRVDSRHQEVTDSHDFNRLSKSTRDELVKAGIFEVDGGSWGKWTVHLQYHWTQSFPAHSTVHIRHEYSPITGEAYEMGEDAAEGLLEAGKMPVDETKPKPLDPNDLGDLTSFCLGLPLAKNMAASFPQQSSNAPKDEKSIPTLWKQWVDFILTSANTWQSPIEDFTLIIERPKAEQGGRVLVSFCSPAGGKVEKLDAEHFQVHLTNFFPTSELHIGFFEVPLAKPTQPGGEEVGRRFRDLSRRPAPFCRYIPGISGDFPKFSCQRELDDISLVEMLLPV